MNNILRNEYMLIYNILLVWLILIQFFKKNICVFAITYFFLLLLAGGRCVDVGTDTKNYLLMYEMLHDSLFSEYIGSLIEPLWIFSNQIVMYIYDDFQLLLLFGAFLAITPISIRAWKSCENPYIAVLFYVLLYYYFNSYNIIRQAIAVSIVFFSYPFWEKGEMKKAVLCIIVAFMFHFTAVVAFLIPVIRKMKLRIENVFLILLGSYFLGNFVFPQLIPLLPIGGKYFVYLSGDNQSNLSITRLLLNLFFCFLLLQYKPAVQDTNMKYFFGGIVLYNLLTFSPALGRIALYFTISQLYIYSNFSYFKSNFILLLSVLFYGLFYFYTLLNGNNSEIVPYVFNLKI